MDFYPQNDLKTFEIQSTENLNPELILDRMLSNVQFTTGWFMAVSVSALLISIIVSIGLYFIKGD